MRIHKVITCCFAFLAVSFLQAQTVKYTGIELLEKIKDTLTTAKGNFAVAFINLQTGEEILWNENENFHAASTMKTPVMIEVYKQLSEGKLSLQQPVIVKNTFRSIVDGSTYTLNASDDSQQALYQKIGTQVPLSELVYQMIILSSNLATNLIMEMVDGRNVTATMRSLGASRIQVLRGVEDGKAFEKGLNNTTTAYDLALIYAKMAKGEVLDKASSDAMIQTLFDQKHNSVIPALLPAGVRVAHKTGSITGVHHDSGIVFLPDGRKYVLVLLSRNLETDAAGTAVMARVSKMVYDYFIQ